MSNIFINIQGNDGIDNRLKYDFNYILANDHIKYTQAVVIVNQHKR